MDEVLEVKLVNLRRPASVNRVQDEHESLFPGYVSGLSPKMTYMYLSHSPLLSVVIDTDKTKPGAVFTSQDAYALNVRSGDFTITSSSPTITFSSGIRIIQNTQPYQNTPV